MKTVRHHLRDLSAILALFALPSASQAGLVGHWTFDESPIGDGGTVADISGATVHDGIMNTVLADAAVAGKIGGAFDFTDSGSDYMVADLGGDFVTGANPASIAFWMNPDNISGQAFVFAWGNNSAGRCVRVSVESGAGGTELRYRHQGGFVAFDAAAMTVDSGWHHVAAVVPAGAVTVGDVIFYMDGAALSVVTPDNDTLNVIAGTGGTNLFIGSNWNGATAFDGQLDDVGWWNSALSPAEISTIYENGLLGIDLEGNGASGSGLILKIASSGANLDFTWDSESGKLYDILSSTGLTTAPATWTPWKSDVSATPPTNNESYARPADPKTFFVLAEKDAPPVEIFSESFDSTTPGSLPTDWTTGTNPADNSSLSNWELGTPANVGPIPPGVPLPSGANCVATNIGGNYDDPVSDLGVAHSDVWLRSPAIDLGAATEGTLTFQQWTEIEDVPGDLDYGSIRILDADDDSELAVMEDQSIDGTTTGWEEYSMPLPAAAFTATAGTIKVEFQFEADDIDSFAGWYIDDVTVTVPGS